MGPHGLVNALKIEHSGKFNIPKLNNMISTYQDMEDKTI